MRVEEQSKVKERFLKDTSRLEMTILYDRTAAEDLPYRHIKFRAKNESWYWFELITWPGIQLISLEFHLIL